MNTGVLLSGGMDSAIALHWAKESRSSATAWSIDYGQKHKKRELEAAKAIAKAAGVPQREVSLRVPWPPIGSDNIVYGRNLMMLSTVAAQLAVRGGGEPVEVVIGANREDYDGFPDCRPEFLSAASKALSLGLGVEVVIAAPFIDRTKAAMLRECKALPGAWGAVAMSWTCYLGGELPCGTCSACMKRSAAFAEIGEADPWHA